MHELPLLTALTPLLLGTLSLFLQWPLWVLSLLIGLFHWLRNRQAVRPKKVSNFFNGFRFGGHRGSPMNAPENTMISFRQAESEGVDLVEFDIGLTKDHVAVILHDETLDRTTNMTGLLRNYLFAKLADCNCAAKFQKLPTSMPNDAGKMPEAATSMEPLTAPLPTLEEVVKWAKNRGIKMIFDVKDTDKELVEQVAQLFERHDLFNSAIVCSFFPSVIYRIKRQNEQILTGITWRRWFFTYHDLEWKIPRNRSPIWHGLALLFDLIWEWSIKSWLPQFLGAEMVLTDRGEISENYVKFMRARGLEVCAWTVNDAREMVWMADKLKIPFLTDVPHIAHPIVTKEYPDPKLLPKNVDVSPAISPNQ